MHKLWNKPSDSSVTNTISITSLQMNFQYVMPPMWFPAYAEDAWATWRQTKQSSITHHLQNEEWQDDPNMGNKDQAVWVAERKLLAGGDAWEILPLPDTISMKSKVQNPHF